MQRHARLAATIAWPAFLLAGVLEMLVFAFVDPDSLHSVDGSALTLSATAIYSIAFFAFWCCTAAACALTVLLERNAQEINAPPQARP